MLKIGGKVMSNSSSGGGIGFLGLLTVSFVVLKLLDIITWSWWLVLLPMYGPAGLFILFFAVFFIILASRSM